MGFIDSYKHLEKLCGEVLNDDRRVSAYIDEMLDTPRGSYYVSTWDEDLRNLKHFRWVRNQISHEPGCTEQNMCNPEDELWLDEFYSRIMNQTDPLTLYHHATRPKPTIKKPPKPVIISPPKSVIAFRPMPVPKISPKPIYATTSPKRPKNSKNKKFDLPTLLLLSLLGLALALFIVIGVSLVFACIHIMF